MHEMVRISDYAKEKSELSRLIRNVWRGARKDKTRDGDSDVDEGDIHFSVDDNVLRRVIFGYLCATNDSATPIPTQRRSANVKSGMDDC